MKNIMYLCLVLLMISCGGNRVVSDSQSDDIQSLIDGGNFNIDLLWAYPKVSGDLGRALDFGINRAGINVNNIDISSHSDYLNLENGVVTAEISFFGERYVGNIAGERQGGISLNGTPENFEFAQKKKYLEWSFKINDAYHQNEIYRFYVEFYDNGKVNISVNSNQRSTISYSGTLQTRE